MTEDAQVWCSNFVLPGPLTIGVDAGEKWPLPDGHWGLRALTCDTVAPAELPEVFRMKTPVDPVPEIIVFASGLIVNERVKALLQGFALGATQFLPIRLTGTLGIDEIEGPWFLMNIAECRSLAVPEQCANCRHRAPGGAWLVGKVQSRGLDLAVRGGPPAGLDLWFDPALNAIVFLSAPLAAAIRRANIAHVQVFPCRQAG